MAAGPPPRTVARFGEHAFASDRRVLHSAAFRTLAPGLDVASWGVVRALCAGRGRDGRCRSSEGRLLPPFGGKRAAVLEGAFCEPFGDELVGGGVGVEPVG